MPEPGWWKAFVVDQNVVSTRTPNRVVNKSDAADRVLRSASRRQSQSNVPNSEDQDSNVRSQLSDLRAAFEAGSDEAISVPVDAPTQRSVAEVLPDLAGTSYQSDIHSSRDQFPRRKESECELGYLSLYADEAIPLVPPKQKTAEKGRGEVPARAAVARSVAEIVPAPKPQFADDRTSRSAQPKLTDAIEPQPNIQAANEVELPPILQHEDEPQEREPDQDSAHPDTGDLVSAEVIPFVRAQVRFEAEYELPSVELLTVPPEPEGPILTEDILEETAGKLEKVIRDFGVKGEVIHVHAGARRHAL